MTPHNMSANTSTIFPKPKMSKSEEKITDFSPNKLNQPLIKETIPVNVSKNNSPRYYVEKYEENCMENSKIEYLECLLEDKNKNFFYYLLSLFTFGIFALILEFFPLLKLKFSYLVTNIGNCSHFFIKCKDGKYYIKKAYEIKLPKIYNNNLTNLTKIPITSPKTKFFEFKLYKYAYNPEKKNFLSISFQMHQNTNYEMISRKMIGGLTEEEINYQKIFIYKNKFVNNVMPINDVLIMELSNPFYFIQLLCIIVFYMNDYSIYNFFLICSTVLILLYTLYETQSHIYYINNLVSYSCKVTVKRKMNTITMNSDELVPGDIVVLPESDFIYPCDMLLITGACISNESFLTGESNPVFKSHIPKNGDKFDKKEQKYILYSGTKLLQSKNDALGLVIGVGFDTEKGKLIRRILFRDDSRELERKNKERYQLIIYLFVIALIGILVSSKRILELNIPYYQSMILYLEILTNLLPSALTISISIGIYISFLRLKKQEISCLDRYKIDIAGNVDTICFDKTGTLTEDHVESYGCRALNFNKKVLSFGNFTDSLDEIREKTIEFYMNNLIKKSKDKTKEENKY
jgi:cation-transporting ATPase 13A3/4/5